MKRQLLDFLICPACLPGESSLKCVTGSESDGDIIHGTLHCPSCAAQYPITNGIACLDTKDKQTQENNKYEREDVVSSYLWSHYGDLLHDSNWSDAYPDWSDQIRPTTGLGLDLGAAVGRFSFELARKCDFVVGIDNSHAFIQAAKRFFHDGRINIRLKEEGDIYREETIHLPPEWQQSRVEWLVADALRLPFRQGAAGIVTSLNLLDKVPHPIQHLLEMERVSRKKDAQLLLSDPFSWSPEAAHRSRWLGGKDDGEFTGYGLENVEQLLSMANAYLQGNWQSENKSHVWWKIRTHRNHYELIKSCYLKTKR